MAGRITLAKSVLSTVPLYPMQVAKIPGSICREIEKMHGGRQKIQGNATKLGGERLFYQKQSGGMGFRRLNSVNRAFGAKLTWNLLIGSNSRWAKTLQQRYMLICDEDLLNVRPGDSKLWRFLCKQHDIIDKGIKWRIRNGRSIRFFSNVWLLPDKDIKPFCTRDLTIEEEESFASDRVIEGTWDFARLANIVTSEILDQLSSTLPPIEEMGEDVMVWGATAHGDFTIRSAYDIIENNPANDNSQVFKRIWKWRGAERIRVFFCGLLLMIDCQQILWRSNWGPSSPLCAYCGSGVEDTMHILRDCSYARKLWMSFIKPRYISEFFTATLKKWMEMNLSKELGKNQNIEWNSLWAVSTWHLWIWRNKLAFEENFQKPSYPGYVLLNTWKLYVHSTDLLNAPTKNDYCQSLSWQSPPLGWVKVNVDGAVSSTNNAAGCGGLIRDHEGKWIIGFSHSLGTCTVHEAEEWAVYKGIYLAWEFGFRKVIVESDSKNVIDEINNNVALTTSTSSITLIQIRDMRKRTWEIQFNHIPRENNDAAEVLAKEGISKTSLIMEE